MRLDPAVVYHTPHSSEDKRLIAEGGLILLSEVGSTMHGVSSSQTGDDIDEMGVCIEPPQYVIGLNRFEQYEFRTQPVGNRSRAGDIDRVIYSLRKFAKLAAQGNPTVLMILYTASSHLRYSNEYGLELRRRKNMFISQQAGHRFLGYLAGQRKKLTGELSARTKRTELIEAYGYDTKYAYHALRLAIQGRELMTEKTVTLPMSEENRSFLLQVRQGKLTLDEVLECLDDQTRRLETTIPFSDWPEHPDYNEVNDWLVNTYQKFW